MKTIVAWLLVLLLVLFTHFLFVLKDSEKEYAPADLDMAPPAKRRCVVPAASSPLVHADLMADVSVHLAYQELKHVLMLQKDQGAALTGERRTILVEWYVMTIIGRCFLSGFLLLLALHIYMT